MLSQSLGDFRNTNPAHQIDVIGVVINDTSDYQAYSTPEKDKALKEIDEEAISENGWYIFKNRLKYSRGFPKMMRNRFANWKGKAPDIFRRFAEEFFGRLPS